jgi:acyl-CoA thioesterase-1
MRSIKWVVFLAVVASLWASEGDRRAILILGDSLAAGSGVDSEEAFPALLQGKIDNADLKYEIINAGVSGDTTAGGLRRIGARTGRQ